MRNSVRIVALFIVIAFSAKLQATPMYILGGEKEPKNKKVKTAFVLQEKKNVVYLNLMNLDLSPVEITVTDEAGRLLFSETVADTQNVEKVLNFKKAFRGTYYIKVVDGSITHTKEVSIL